MPVEIVMPRLSDSMEEGTIVEWLKRVGDQVSAGEPLVEIDTDKALMTYESDTSGVLLEISAQEGETVPVGRVIARIGQLEDQRASESPGPETSAAARPPAARAVDASPLAKRLAAEHGLDLATVVGTGPGGRITEADVQRTLGTSPSGKGQPESPKGAVAAHPLNSVQRTVARRMTEAKTTIPHFYLSLDVDMTRVIELRDGLRPRGQPEAVPSITDVIVTAVARALREHPRVNSAYQEDRIDEYGRVNVGIAVAADEALLVPTVFDADRQSLQEVAETSRLLAEKVRHRAITADELAGGTFTVSSLGMYGIDTVVPVINPPQAAILGVGAVQSRACVDPEGNVQARPRSTFVLACDHRALYGAEGAAFLTRVRDLLEDPSWLT